jgi:hypothetical protein
VRTTGKEAEKKTHLSFLSSSSFFCAYINAAGEEEEKKN